MIEKKLNKVADYIYDENQPTIINPILPLQITIGMLLLPIEKIIKKLVKKKN